MESLWGNRSSGTPTASGYTYFRKTVNQLSYCYQWIRDMSAVPIRKNELVLFKLDLRSDLRHLSLFFTIRINEEHLAFLKEQNTGLCALFSPVEQQINTFDEEEIRIVENREYNHQDFIPPVWDR